MKSTKRSGVTIAAVVVAMALPGCASVSPVEQNKRIVQRVFDEALNQGRYELFDEAYAPDFVKHVDGKGESLAEEREDAKGTRAISSDLVMTVDAMVAESDKVAVLYSGRAFALSGMTLYRFAGGKVVEEWTV